MVHIMAKEMFGVLVQESNEALPEGMVVLESFNDLVAEMRAYHYDAMTFTLKLKAMVCSCQIQSWTFPHLFHMLISVVVFLF